MRVIAALAVVALFTIAASLAWLAGEQHQANCIRADRTDCRVFPWSHGTPPETWGVPPSLLGR